MSINWQTVLDTLITTVGGGGILLAGVAWLVKAIVSSRLALETERFKVEMKASADAEIERVKAFLAKGAVVHQRQLGILQSLYAYLCEAQGLFQRMTSAGRMKDEATPEEYGNLVTKAMESAFNELVRGRLFIPQALARDCDKFFDTMFKGRLTFTISQDALANPESRYKLWKEAAAVSHQEVPKILLQIEEAARAIIHGETPKTQ